MAPQHAAQPHEARSGRRLIVNRGVGHAPADQEEARELLGRADVTFVDLRDPRELWREGSIPGAVNVPRGMLEFWIDPESPYHKRFFASGNRFVFFCGAGWRSALATKVAQDMGLEPVCHIEGGYTVWKDSGAPVQAVEPKGGHAPAKA